MLYADPWTAETVARFRDRHQSPGETDLEFGSGTQPGEVVVLRGRGMPVLQGFGRGDQRILVNVAVPRQLTDEQRDLLEQFERSADEHTYRPDEGFFDKLKSAFR